MERYFHIVKIMHFKALLSSVDSPMRDGGSIFSHSSVLGGYLEQYKLGSRHVSKSCPSHVGGARAAHGTMGEVSGALKCH